MPADDLPPLEDVPLPVGSTDRSAPPKTPQSTVGPTPLNIAFRPSAVFEEVPDEDDTDDYELPAIDLADDLLADQSIELPPEIVKGVLHKGTKGVLASASKAGKTWLLLDLAVCVATGNKFLKWETTQGKVLFVNFEIPRPFMRERVRAIKNKRQIQRRLENLHIWTLRGHAANFSILTHKIIQRIRNDNYSLIVLDPIYKAMGGRDENTASGVGVLCSSIEDIAVKTGAAVVYAHHFTKGNQAGREAIDRMSGSGVFARDADTIVTLTPHDREDCYAVEMTLRNFPSQDSFVVEFEFPVMQEREDLDPDDLRGKGGRPAGLNEETMLTVLQKTPLHKGDWQKKAGEAGVKYKTFYRLATKLEKAGKVTLDRKSMKFGLAENGRGQGESEDAEDKQTQAKVSKQTGRKLVPNPNGS